MSMEMTYSAIEVVAEKCQDAEVLYSSSLILGLGIAFLWWLELLSPPSVMGPITEGGESSSSFYVHHRAVEFSRFLYSK